MRVIVTRPQPQADDWVARLRAGGLAAEALPLLRIAAPADLAPVRRAWAGLGERAMVMFVSPNAVAQFFETAPAGLAWPAGVWAASTGPGTSAALARAGVPPTQVLAPDEAAAKFDSETLWTTRLARLRDWQGARVLIVRGEGGRDWLARTLDLAGATVDFVEAYRRLPPALDAHQQAVLDAALADPQAHAWLFSSSEAVGHLAALAPQARWAGARALASHPRIAETARAAGFGTVQQVVPTVDAVLEALR
jgi:uroporphyrinogen-III synthase